ncbi:MAG TPA: alpha/beta hydrolase [Ferruginibacter sp.]|nr:alpha/beta hydrolase [Ferruginibacter sp.]
MKRTVIILVILTAYFIFGQCCMRFRWSDNKANKVFSARQVPLQISDTVVQGQNIHYVISGADTLPTMVFIHGSPGSWSHYMKFMWDDELRKKFRFISIDRPGFGYSEFGSPMHLKEQSEIILKIVLAKQNGKPIYLAGHSIGGPVVAQMAAMSPGSFEKIIIISGSISPYLEKKENWRHLMNNSLMVKFLPGAFAPSNTEILWFKKDLYQLEKELPNINTHVIFIHGDKDSWVPIENIAFGKKSIINAKSIMADTIFGADHQVPWKNMKEVKNILLNVY